MVTYRVYLLIYLNNIYILYITCIIVKYQYCYRITYFNDPSWFLFQTLAEIDKWGIDIFRIADLTNNRPLTAIAYTVFQVTTTTTIITALKETTAG